MRLDRSPICFIRSTARVTRLEYVSNAARPLSGLASSASTFVRRSTKRVCVPRPGPCSSSSLATAASAWRRAAEFTASPRTAADWAVTSSPSTAVIGCRRSAPSCSSWTVWRDVPLTASDCRTTRATKPMMTTTHRLITTYRCVLRAVTAATGSPPYRSQRTAARSAGQRRDPPEPSTVPRRPSPGGQADAESPCRRHVGPHASVQRRRGEAGPDRQSIDVYHCHRNRSSTPGSPATSGAMARARDRRRGVPPAPSVPAPFSPLGVQIDAARGEPHTSLRTDDRPPLIVVFFPAVCHHPRPNG